METYTMTRMSERLTRFDDNITSTCYLLEGSQRNLLIDTGSGAPENFRKMLEPFAEKPLLLAITHGHADHYANAGLPGLFNTVYMHPDDIAILPEMNRFFSMAMGDQGRQLEPNTLTPLREPGVIDLGDMCIDVLDLPGHSPGSVCFMERDLGLLFTGDAVGSGGEFWMQLPNAVTIAQYHKNLADFIKKLPDVKLRLLGGHYSQAGDPDKPGYSPVTIETMHNLLHVCEHLVRGDEALRIEHAKNDFGNSEVRIAFYKDVQMVFLPGSVR